ncbi:MAG: hypothetical protein ABI868_11020 [Acidobacteriota bacterium]
MRAGAVVTALAMVGGLSTSLEAQVGFAVHDRPVQIHGFVSEGFACSDDNNYLRMTTSEGSFFVEAGVNASAQITDRLRVGVQIYDRSIGELGKGRVYLDFAFADYRFKDWLGIRAGKVKTSLGLHTDTQDQEFLHTWALLPQAVYPLDLRSVTAAHVGADLYGHVDMKGAGSLAYTGYVGSIPQDPHGGYVYSVEGTGGRFNGAIEGRMTGIDVRWAAPVAGLTVGTSLVTRHRNFSAAFDQFPFPISYSTTADRIAAIFAEYTYGGFHTEAEYRREKRRADIYGDIPDRPLIGSTGSDETAWFTSGAYRFSRWFEIGAYYGHFHVRPVGLEDPAGGPGRDHIDDKTVTLRFDLTRFWEIKIEGHFIDGVGNSREAHGFYPQDNPEGFTRTTNMLVVRTGFYF